MTKLSFVNTRTMFEAGYIGIDKSWLTEGQDIAIARVWKGDGWQEVGDLTFVAKGGDYFLTGRDLQGREKKRVKLTLFELEIVGERNLAMAVARKEYDGAVNACKRAIGW